ncbi:LysR substrate-binding domain-containing protein [Alcaligenes nematophilus]|uniref:LysR substrate-binding domain-containing protein n=1 Tax=Alcaligenes faecalis TaxID=511 RepID=A0AAE9HET7_ALCFA|nr:MULTISPECIES: LysR substrate-binding domain-containing protein [Alcaligenes]MDY7129692.1 LysR substrate-binding domain-containing protein [Alcaligenes nematophilus]UPL23341.1 LysR substrate-binding domain-containing protein [Alcaligenes faecalis]
MLQSPINPARVDFVTLRLFCAVAQTGSITKGAERCNLALSAASRRIADFEAISKAVLMERSARGVRLTPAGHIALQHAIRLFQGFELFSNEISEYSNGFRGHVRLWANMSALVEFLPSALESFLQHYPETRVEVEEQLSGDIVRALIEGVADVGIFVEGPPTHGLNVLPFRTDELVVLCANTHPLAEVSEIDFRRCLSYDFVGLNRGSSLLNTISSAAQDHGFPLRLRVQVRSFDAMSEMIASNLGIGVLPLGACFRKLEPMKLKAIRLTDAWAKRRLLIATNASRALYGSTTLLVEHLRQIPG